MQYPNHLSAKQHLQRLAYVGALSVAEPAEHFATWLLTGTAAILGLIIVNVDAVSNVLSEGSLRWGLSLMTLSMLCGVITKQLGIAIKRGVALLDELYAELNTPRGGAIQELLRTPIDDVFTKEMVSPFLPPFKSFMLKSMQHGATDALASEKRFIKMFCLQMYASYAQGSLGAAGIIWLVCGIK